MTLLPHYVSCSQAIGKRYGDPTSPFVAPSISDAEYILVVYDYHTNTIHANAFPARLTTHIIEAYDNIFYILTSNGILSQLLTIDNKVSTTLVDFVTASSLDIQPIPPYLHRCNSGE